MPKIHYWLKLDNAGKIFPGQNTERWSNVFRCTLVLTERVDPAVLEAALVDTLPRFPCFDVRIRSGLFWYYLETNPKPAPPVRPDINNPCYRIKFNENDRFLFRVFYRENRISVEFFHALTDGSGASSFLCTLAAQYLRRMGHDIPPGGSVLDLRESASREELCDPFLSVAGDTPRSNRNRRPVYHAKGTPLPPHTVGITTGVIPMDSLHAKAKELGATVTEFLAALLLYVHYEKQRNEERRQRDVSVQIPVNLRRPFNSRSLRNFSLTYSVRIDPNLGVYTFEEVLRQLALYLRYINNEKTLRAMTAANLKLESGLLRFAPLFIKNLGIGISFRLTGEHGTSILCSNLGRIEIPPAMSPFVQRLDFLAGPGKINGVRCACAGLGDVLSISFTNIYKETDLERAFFTRLVKMGIPVKIESNRK